MSDTAGLVSVVIVTHDSQEVLAKCLQGLEKNLSHLRAVRIVDSGSKDKSYLNKLNTSLPLEIVYRENIGFGVANNCGIASLGLRTLADKELLLFLNPDVFLKDDSLQSLRDCYAKRPEIGAVGARLVGYDLVRGVDNGRLDSTGIFRKWYGRWYDRARGEEDLGQHQMGEEVPAICGAFFCITAGVAKRIKLHADRIFDEFFFLYKEDIELSLRIKKAGYRLWYEPAIVASHLRGWHNRRELVPYSLRLMAAENEILLYRRHFSLYILWAWFKYLVVRFLKK